MRVKKEHRQKAREWQAEKLERLKLRETKIAELLSGLDVLEEQERIVASKILELRELEMNAKDLEEASGLPSKEQAKLLRALDEGSDEGSPTASASEGENKPLSSSASE